MHRTWSACDYVTHVDVVVVDVSDLTVLLQYILNTLI